MAENNNRWWEFYLARYLAANMFAVLVLFYLVTFHGDDIRTSLCQGNNEVELCNEDTKINTKDKEKLSIHFSKTVFDFIFVTTKEVTSTENDLVTIESDFILNKNSKIDITEINFANIFVLGVFGFLYMYISSIPIYFFHIIRSHEFGWDGIFGFLKESTTKREQIEKGKHWNFSPEYVTSYKHMREHGNAFGIILMEILFASFLVATNFSLIFIIIWLLFGFFGWFLGIILEFKMIGKHYIYFISIALTFFCILAAGAFYLISTKESNALSCFCALNSG